MQFHEYFTSTSTDPETERRKIEFCFAFFEKNHSFTTSSKLNPLYCTEKIEAGENRV